MHLKKEAARSKAGSTPRPAGILRYAACAMALAAVLSVGQATHAQNKALAFGFGAGTTEFTESGAAFANLSGGVVLMPAITVLTADVNVTQELNFSASADANLQLPRSAAYVGLGGLAGAQSTPYVSGGATSGLGDGFIQFRARLWPDYAYVGVVLGIPF